MESTLLGGTATLDLEKLRQRCSSGEQFDYLYFWGHQPPKDGEVTKSCLSQWCESSFAVDGTVYQTAEHWMMAAKARLFGDEESLLQILDSNDPKTAEALGRKVKNFDESVWDENARRFVTEGNIATFSQGSHLREFLLRSGAAVESL